MTPEEQVYRDMWLREMWPTVYQYVPPVELSPPPVERPVEKPRKGAA